MAAFVVLNNLCGVAKIGLKRPAPVTAFVRTYWNKDWKPGPYPRTPEERAAAAKKYGMLPEDYEPYPDDGFARGDYPMLPFSPHLRRDPYYDWDSRELKRNFGEPISVDDDIYIEERLDARYKTKLSNNQKALVFLSMMLFFASIFMLGEIYSPPFKLMPKSYPQAGVVHYTFEPEDGSPPQS